jgi:DNA polymerase-3 subunit delta
MELEKLVAYVGERSSITVRDVEAATSHLAESTIFMLVDAIGERRADAALRALAEILREEAPPYVLFMIARQFRMLLRTSTLVARRTTTPMLQQALGVPGFVARRYADQARNFPVSVFPPIFARLQEADYAVKTTGLPRLALETLIVTLCMGAPQRGQVAPIG